MFIIGSLFFVIGQVIDVGTKIDCVVGQTTFYCQQKTSLESFQSKTFNFTPSAIEFTSGIKVNYNDLEFKIEEVCGHSIDISRNYDAPVNSWEFSIKKTNYQPNKELK